jgi:phage tail-like protein
MWKVRIEGIVEGSFLAVKGLESTTEVQETADGSNLLVRKRPGRCGYANLVLRRNLGSGDELWNWYRTTVEGRVRRREGDIVLLGGKGAEIVRLRFAGAWPCRWRSYTPHSAGRAAMIEEIELVVEHLERVSSRSRATG